MEKPTVADTIREISRNHIEHNNGILLGQAITAVGWVNNTVPNCKGIIELPMTDVAGSGIAVGCALVGRRPIFVIRFQDFLILNGSPLIFYAAKCKELHGTSAPIFVRAIAAEGMGPVHSGVLHSIFMHFPGFRVCSPMTPNEYKTIWEDFMNHNDPMIVSEHRLSYANTEELFNVVHKDADVTLYPISATRFETVKAADILLKEGIKCNIIHLLWLKPFVINEELIEPLTTSKKGIVIDAGHEICGAARSIAYELSQKTGIIVNALALNDATKCLCHPLRNELPSAEKICEAVKEILKHKRVYRENNYKGVMVKKPWGYEYLMYQNEKVAIWFLHIDKDKSTSLHCHPQKKTGYVLLKGEAEVTFIQDSVRLNAISKLMIREGLFHSTKAISNGGIDVIEIETPPKKENLVRLEDAYGRKGKPYEKSDQIVPLSNDYVQISEPIYSQTNIYNISGVKCVVEQVYDLNELKKRPLNEILVVLDGNLCSAEGEIVLGHGDVITISTYLRLVENFISPQGLLILSIKVE